MADSSNPNGDWFAPKRFGYGAGLPIAWQGWAVLAAYLAVVLAAGPLLLPRLWPVWLAVVIGATVLLATVSARHTRGGWRWRWGQDD